MRHLFTSFLLLFCALTANAALHVYVANTDQLLEQDTKITITDFQEEFGDLVATVTGQVRSDETNNLSVTITRTNPNVDDSFCAGGNCINTNNEATQNIAFRVSNPTESEIIIHYTPQTNGTETVSYTFSDGINPDIMLTIDFVCQAMAVENVSATPVQQGIFTILGQRIAVADFDLLPKGIYIVNGKKVIKQ